MTTATNLEPITPFYRYNATARPVRLYKGQIAGIAHCPLPGEIRMNTSSKLSIVWQAESAGIMAFGSRLLRLNLNGPFKSNSIEAYMRTWDEGWINEAELGSKDTRLAKAKLHWFNLPRLRSARRLHSDNSNTTHVHRWEINIAGWALRMDCRPDYDATWVKLHDSEKFLMTHVMEVTRVDGSDYGVDELKSLLLALHMSFSFATGCHVAPALPVGFDRFGRVAWKQWTVPHCDPARSISPGWRAEFQTADFDSYVQLAVPALMDSPLSERLRFQLMFAISSTIPSGFVEQRIMVGFAGIEHFTWHRLVVDGHLSKSAYQKLDGHERLREVLKMASIPTGLDPAVSPALVEFARVEGARQGRALDAAHVVTQIRNRIVHPTDLPKLVYHINDLITESWALTRHLLTLLILQTLNYRGSTRDLSRLTGSAHEVVSVPWK
ncbi:hypothetical protein OOJ91_02095 [Micromonospora lupini]|uniref:hypothetical protein n=1 Tax=Micromonospora lupini TaxID=285679 RepID=UPI00225128EA|nr:hypothetical protein [Micromonospora lupini]MCX5064660.1 hypothetical protein [Micromonospora lupini]